MHRGKTDPKACLEKKTLCTWKKNTFPVSSSERVHFISKKVDELVLITKAGVEFSNMLQR